MSSTEANNPNPDASPKLCCRLETPRNLANRSKNKIRPHWTNRTERCRLVTANVMVRPHTSAPVTPASPWVEFEKATTTDTSTITTPVHLNNTVPKSLSVSYGRKTSRKIS